MSISPAVAHGLRTLGQGLIAALGTISVDKLFNGLDPQIIASLQILLTFLVSTLHNALEDSGTIPSILKPVEVPVVAPVAVAVPQDPPPAEPVPGDSP